MERRTTYPRATYLGYFGPHRGRLLLGVLAAGSAAFAATVTPHFIGAIFDEVRAGAELAPVLRLAAFMVGTTLVEAALRVVGRYQILNTGRRIEYAIRRDLFAHLQRLELRYFQTHRTGDLMTRFTRDLDAVRMMSSFGIVALVQTSLTLVFCVAAMISLSLELTLYALAILPVATAAFLLLAGRVAAMFERLQEQFGELASKAQENFSGIRVVKAFAQEEAEIRSFSAATDEFARRGVALVKLNGLTWPVMNLLVGIGVLATLYVGAQDAIRGELTVGQLVQFIAYLQLLSQPMIMLGQVLNIVQQGWASMGRLQEVFDERPAIADPADARAAVIRGGVEMRHVSFSYDGAPVLHDVSFRVPAGGSLAIVGPTGAGKSTLVNLIPRLFDATEGEVLIDGVDVRRYSLAALRRAVGYVPQETFLFSMPLRDNVGFGLDAPLADERLAWAGDVSQLGGDVADFPAGYDTMIGERGVTLSGGQRQRAGIARAVAKDPRILILDDAMSAVDTHTESEILRRLRGMVRDRTSIVVAHRISSVRDANEILFLERGRIAERGTHSELLARGGLYARMYRHQLLEEELEVDEEQAEHERRVVRAEDAPEPLEPRLPGGVLGEGTV